jgi:TonB family protein
MGGSGTVHIQTGAVARRGTPKGKAPAGGGDPDSKGTGTGPPKPASIASIKVMPKPVGETDYFDAKRDYPAEARAQGIEGMVKVRLLVDETGAVRSRKVVKKLGYGFDQLALRLAKRLRFKPAIDTSGRPVAAVVVWTFNFTL